jgi:hypothetical protein
MAGREIHGSPSVTRPELIRDQKAKRAGHDGAKPSSWFARLRDFALADLQTRGIPPDLTEDEILEWADSHHDRHGQWPTFKSGRIPEAPGETWLAVEAALSLGLRGMPGGSTLPQLLSAYRRRYNQKDFPFTVEQILEWADQWHARTGDWPTRGSGDIPGGDRLNWNTVDHALRHGRGSLIAGSSLSRLLAFERGVFHRLDQPALTENQILAWADEHHRRTGSYPGRDSGSIVGASTNETWIRVDCALRAGIRGLPGGSSVARLLTAHYGHRRTRELPRLGEPQILEWADAHHDLTGKWPVAHTGRISSAPAESWHSVDLSLRRGLRGLPGGSSLAQLLAEQRGLKKRHRFPPLTVNQILAWADSLHEKTGRWPTVAAGEIPEASGETWSSVHGALYKGTRGLPPGSSLIRLLAQERGVRNEKNVPPLAVSQILDWADSYYNRLGEWPTRNSGAIPEAPGETWLAVQQALHCGTRGLPGGSTLARLLEEKRGARNRRNLPPMSEQQILAWADAHHARHGQWPNCRSGAIPDAPGETWLAVETALSRGVRGMPGGSSLTKLLVDERGIRNRNHPPALTTAQILAWAGAHKARTGRWPTAGSGPITEAPDETWAAISEALYAGLRGLPGSSSLHLLLRQKEWTEAARSRRKDVPERPTRRARPRTG